MLRVVLAPTSPNETAVGVGRTSGWSAAATSTSPAPARVAVYRYPEVPATGPVSSRLDGPEQVFRVSVTGAVANFGVVITQRGAGSRVEPRVVAEGNENRLTGYPALPVNLNPYVDEPGAGTRRGRGDPADRDGPRRDAEGSLHLVRRPLRMPLEEERDGA